MIRKLVFSSWLTLLLATTSFAQGDVKQHFFNGKNLFREGKYNLAMEAFKQAIPYDANNPFSEYASFYYALSAYNQGYLAVAKDMFNQIKKLYPNWNRTEEVNFWLGKIHLDEGEYFQGLKVWSSLQNPSIRKSIEALKPTYLAGVTDAETIRMMLEEYPQDKQIAHALANVLAQNITDKENRAQLEELITKYKLKRSDFVSEAPPTYFKDRYSVSVLYPFLLSTLEPTPSKKRNQVILDMYEGMRLAADTLEKNNIHISLRAYDTERKTSTIQRILATEELKNTDLIIGPFFPEENKAVQDFSVQHRINLFKPFTNNLDMVGGNTFGFLLQPSYETLGRKSADFLADYTKARKNCMVFFGTNKKDSVMAGSFIKQARERGINVVSAEGITKEESGRIIRILATPTEYDEWKNPTQFELKKDSLGSIFVASDDPLIYTKVVSSVETRKDSIVVVGSETWLDHNAIDLDKFQALGIVLASPNFVSAHNPHYIAFQKKYIRTYGKLPSYYAKLGYELIMFAGHSLHRFGVYFQDGFNREKVLPGYLYEGFSYQFSRDNQLVPFIRFKKGEPVVIDKR